MKKPRARAAAKKGAEPKTKADAATTQDVADREAAQRIVDSGKPIPWTPTEAIIVEEQREALRLKIEAFTKSRRGRLVMLGLLKAERVWLEVEGRGVRAQRVGPGLGDSALSREPVTIRRAGRRLKVSRVDGLDGALDEAATWARAGADPAWWSGNLALRCIELGEYEAGILLAASLSVRKVEYVEGLSEALERVPPPYSEAAAYVLDGRRDCEPLEQLLNNALASTRPPDPVDEPDAASHAPEDLAMAHLTRAVRENRPIPSMRECARVAGVHHSAVSKWKIFPPMHQHAKATEKSGSVRRGRFDRRTGSLEADSE